MQQQSIISQGIRSAMATPLFDNKNVIGILYADTTDPTRHYTRDELVAFSLLANVIGGLSGPFRLGDEKATWRPLRIVAAFYNRKTGLSDHALEEPG